MRVRWRKFRQRAALHGAAVADDADAIAERLDLGQDVAGEQHGAPAAALLGDTLAEHRSHQRVEARTGSSSNSSSTSDASAATSATFCRFRLE